ncbi:MAG: multiheme c-type cytochrome [Ginsengibacter sp.]
MRYLKISIVTLIIFFIILTISQCSNKEESVIKNYKGQEYAGSQKCADCHKNIFESHLKTAHHLTSQPAIAKYIKGVFDSGKNSYYYNQSVYVSIEKRDSGFYQVEYFRGSEKKAKRMDIVIGSGTMGQSFLNWRGDHLFQLPITYFTAANAWSNSPGFPDKVLFNRLITSRCLECHASMAKVTSIPDVDPESFASSQIIFGVECEKCHGPGAEHVNYEKQHLADKAVKFIINPKHLTRQQNLDLCASCHGGRLQKLKPSFEFTAGDALADFFRVDTLNSDPEKIDVHGNQYGLLRASKCFRASSTLTCNSCHNSHENEKGNVALFSERCMTCHNSAHTAVTNFSTNCIDCHMPLKSSKAIAVQLEGGEKPIAALIRSHLIKVYPDETKKFIESLKKINN